jgi:hypothetical protein
MAHQQVKLGAENLFQENFQMAAQHAQKQKKALW